MIYIPWHIGDWATETRLLPATERGVLMDLLIQYYTAEQPITVDQCTRIARAYAPAEQDALQYVLQEFFTLENGVYRSAKCDAEIAKVAAMSETKKRAAQARWSAKTDGKTQSSSQKTQANQQDQAVNAPDASAMHVDMHLQCTCNANQNQNQNQNNKEKEKEIKEKPADAVAAPSAAPRSRSKKFEPEELRTGQIDRHLFADWLAVRKARRAPLTETAWAQVKREAGKAGISLDAALRLMVEHSWQGISADWDAVQAAAGKAPAPAQQARSISAFSQPVELLPTDAERHAWDAKIAGDQQGRDPVAWARQTLAAPVGPWIASKARAVLAKRGLAA